MLAACVGATVNVTKRRYAKQHISWKNILAGGWLGSVVLPAIIGISWGDPAGYNGNLIGIGIVLGGFYSALLGGIYSLIFNSILFGTSTPKQPILHTTPIVTSQITKIDEDQQRFRECPWCADRIPEYAKVCKHCGRDVEPLLITTEEIIKLLINHVADMPATDFVKECIDIGMQQVPYQKVDQDSNLPMFDKGYHFRFIPDNKGNALFEILEKDDLVLQAGYQIVFKADLFFSKALKMYNQIREILETYYGEGQRMNIYRIKTINFRNDTTIAYLSKAKIAGVYAITIRVGNRFFFDGKIEYVCSECGADVTIEDIKCPKCGKEL
jgi:hypothetical protein